MIGDSVSRHRSMVLKDDSRQYSRQLVWDYYGSCTAAPQARPPVTYTGEAWSSYHGKTMDDIVTQGYKILSGRGIIINNPKKTVETIREWLPGYKEVVCHHQKWGCTPARWYDYANWQEIGDDSSKAVITSSTVLGTNPWLAEPSLSATELTALNELALTSAYARINASDVMSLVSIAESEKTLVGLYNSFVRVLKIIGRLNSLLKKADRNYSQAKNLKKFKRDLKDLGYHTQQFYMEARYGLRPLYYDVMGLLKFLTKPKLTKDRLTFRGKQVWSAVNTDTVVKTVPLPGGYYFKTDVPFHRTTSKDVFIRAGVLTRYKDYGHVQGLGLDLLAETAWELVPFSFIVDWFINAGELIASWTPNVGFTTLTSWVTQEIVVTKTIIAGTSVITDLSTSTNRCVNPIGNYTLAGSETIITKQRIPQPKKPTSLHFNVKLSALKLLDLAIILKQLKSVSTLIKTLRV